MSLDPFPPRRRSQCAVPWACFIHEDRQRGTETASDGPGTPLRSGCAPSWRLQFAREAGFAHSLDWRVILLRASDYWLGFCFQSLQHCFWVSPLVRCGGLFPFPLCPEFHTLIKGQTFRKLLRQSSPRVKPQKRNLCFSPATYAQWRLHIKAYEKWRA